MNVPARVANTEVDQLEQQQRVIEEQKRTISALKLEAAKYRYDYERVQKCCDDLLKERAKLVNDIQKLREREREECVEESK